ncbi:MAG: sulfotransferase [Candidatus Aminicenantales bacterium]
MLKIWAGCSLPGWWRLLARNRFKVAPRHIPEAMLYTLTAAYHSLLSGVQGFFVGSKIAAVRIDPPPVFILGHWRTGTTLLHTLLGLDEQFTYPTTSQCLNPSHLHLRGYVERLIMRRNIPGRRPMDSMAMSSDSPQEDEFALCLLGAPSPYQKLAFPSHPLPDPGSWEVEDLPPRLLHRWKESLMYFLKQVLFLRPGRLELKSPPHTCRVKVLSELFPEARFITMVRSPYAVIPSTINLWKTLYQSQSLQRPSWAGLEDAVFQTFNLFYERLEQSRWLVPGERFCQVRFEDLAADPLGQMRRVYEHLGLGDFDRLRPALEGYLAAHPHYRGRDWELSPALRRRITEECRPYLERYGYLHVPAIGGFEEEDVVARSG